MTFLTSQQDISLYSDSIVTRGYCETLSLLSWHRSKSRRLTRVMFSTFEGGGMVRNGQKSESFI